MILKEMNKELYFSSPSLKILGLLFLRPCNLLFSQVYIFSLSQHYNYYLLKLTVRSWVQIFGVLQT